MPSAVEARLAGDVIRDLRALTPSLVGAVDCRRVGDEPLYVPLTYLPLPDFMTFTRGSDGWFRQEDDSNGERWAAAGGNDLPRIHSPDGKLSRRGLLVEPSRKNGARQSAALDSATWQDGGTPIVTANARVAPDGTTAADDVEDNDAGAEEYRYVNNFQITAGVDAAISGFVRYVSGDGGAIFFYDGTAWAAHTGIVTSDVGWKRYSAVAENKHLSLASIPCCPASADALPASDPETGKLSYWGLQVEEGSYPTSYIPTEASRVTRAAEVCTIALSALVGRVEGARGRLRLIWIPQFATADGPPRAYLWSLGSNWAVHYQNGAFRLLVNGAQTDTASISHAVGDVYAVDWQWGNGNTYVDIWKNGAFADRMTSAWVTPTLTIPIYLGCKSNGTSQASGTIRGAILG